MSGSTSTASLASSSNPRSSSARGRAGADQGQLAGDDGLQRQLDGRRHVTDEDDAASAPRARDRGADRGRDADRLDDHVGATAAGRLGDGAPELLVVRPDCDVRAEPAGELEPLLVEVDPDHAGSAGEAQRLDGEEADHPGADDGSGGARHLAREPDGVQRHGERLGEGGPLERELVREPRERPARHGHVLREGSVAAVAGKRRADHLAKLAEVRAARDARGARAAGERRLEGDPVARLPLCHAAACAHDDTCCLVPHDQRRRPAARGAVVAVHVAAADPAGAHRHEHVIVPDGGVGHVHVGKRQEVVEVERLHGGYGPPRT